MLKNKFSLKDTLEELIEEIENTNDIDELQKKSLFLLIVCKNNLFKRRVKG